MGTEYHVYGCQGGLAQKMRCHPVMIQKKDGQTSDSYSYH